MFRWLLNPLIHWAVAALTLWLVAYLLPGVDLASWQAAFMASLALGLVNTLIRPLVGLLALPITLLTLGLFSLVINAAMIWLTAQFVPGFVVHDFISALLAAVLMGLLSGPINFLIAKPLKA